MSFAGGVVLSISLGEQSMIGIPEFSTAIGIDGSSQAAHH
jgi:hypothetical protein